MFATCYCYYSFQDIYLVASLRILYMSCQTEALLVVVSVYLSDGFA